MTPGVAAMGAPGTATAVSLSQTSTEGATIGICQQDVTVSAGPDFETTKDESVRFVADVEPADAVEVTSYEWRVTNENGNANARGNRRGGTNGQNEQLLSTDRSFETQLDPGQQQITLTVETAGGETLTDSVSVLGRGNGQAAERDTAPIADAGDCRMVIAGEDTTLQGTESYDRDGTITSYEWDTDGDGATEATGEQPTVQFTELGERTVGLTTTDDGGNTDTDTVDLLVNDRPRPAVAYTPTRPNPDQTVRFDASGSADTLGGIESYEWIVDGQPVKTGEKIEYAFDEPGNHTVELVVTDAYGVTNATTTTVSVNAPPTADASNSETQGTVSEPLVLSGTASTDRENGITSYEWDVDGDGSFEKTGSTVSQVFDTAGTRTVSLRVTDDGGLTDTDTVTVEVNAPPEASFSSSPATVIVGESVGFDATASADSDGEITSYEWAFADGTTATGPTVDHAPSAAGSYTVSLTVTDDDGATDTATRSIMVLPDEIDIGDGNDTDDGSNDDGTVGLPSPPENADGSSGTGDPHMTTFDGRNYDFQGAGEFVLARAPNGSLSVQGRMVPWRGRQVSVHRAVATLLDGQNVSIDATDSTPLVVDGQRHALEPTDSLAVGNGTIFRRGDRYIVVYPGADGDVGAGDERLTVELRRGFIDVWLTLDDNREHAVEGIFGTPDENAPDVALANGTPVSPSDYEALYGPFRDDWRVDSLEQSHFHYESGESPDSFYDPGFPGSLLTVDSLNDEDRSAAEQAALEAGLEPGTTAFENAVLDYALTGDESFLESAALSRPANASFTIDAGDSFSTNVSEATGFAATVQNGSTDDVSVEWRFGDGETATGSDVSHTYDETGTYTVTVTATGPNGGIARDTLAVTVTGLPPVPSVTETQLNDTHIQLDASGSVDPDGSIAGYAWDTTGDGSVDSRGETVIVSLESSVTEVSLVVLDDDGNTASTVTEVADRIEGNVVGETGEVSVSADEGSFQTVTLDNSYENPVVLAKPASKIGGNPANPRLRNVESDSFEIQIEEWSYLDGPHATETVHYVVMEAGTYELEDGTEVDVGTLNTDESWKSESFGRTFDSTPILFTAAQTFNGPDVVVTRNRNLDRTGFSTRLQESEAKGGHTTETVGYIAVEPGVGQTGSIPFEAGRTPDTVEEYFYRIDFDQSYSSDRTFIADLQVPDGPNTASLRYRSFTSNSVEVQVEEEQSSDSEQDHTETVVGYLVFDSSGDIHRVDDTPKTIINEEFDAGTAGFTSDTGNLETRSGDGIDILAPYCTESANTRRVSKTLNADVNSFTYDVRVVPLDSWDDETLTFQYRDDSGWHTIESDRFQWPRGVSERWPTVDCLGGLPSPQPETFSGTISTVDGTLHEIRFTTSINQDDHDESMAIDYVRLNRTG